VTTWPRPALASLRGTALGAVDYDFWFGGPADPPHVRPAEQDFDALLYFGPPSSITLAPSGEAHCSDPAYLATRLSRIQFRESEQAALEVRKVTHRLFQQIGEACGLLRLMCFAAVFYLMPRPRRAAKTTRFASHEWDVCECPAAFSADTGDDTAHAYRPIRRQPSTFPDFSRCCQARRATTVRGNGAPYQPRREAIVQHSSGRRLGHGGIRADCQRLDNARLSVRI